MHLPRMFKGCINIVCIPYCTIRVIMKAYASELSHFKTDRTHDTINSCVSSQLQYMTSVLSSFQVHTFTVKPYYKVDTHQRTSKQQ